MPFIDYAERPGPFYAYKLGWSFADWLTNRVPFVASDEDGLWYATVTEGIWFVFEGATAPTSWAQAISDGFSTTYFGDINTGDYSVVVNVTDGTDAIPGARVTIRQGSTIIRTAYTSDAGQAAFLMNAGSYTLSVYSFGFDVVSSQSLTVDGNETVAISLNASDIPEVPEPGLCTVRFVVKKFDGTTAIQNARIEAKLSLNAAIDSALLSNVKSSGLTNASGICDLILVQGDSIIKGSKYYTIEIWDPNDPDACVPMSRFRAIVPSDSTFIYAEELLSS